DAARLVRAASEGAVRDRHGTHGEHEGGAGAGTLAMTSARRLPLLFLAVALAFGAGGARAEEPRDADQRTRNDAAWRQRVAAEELVGSLDPALARLARAVRNLELPGADTRALFDDPVVVTDIADFDSTAERVTAAPAVLTRKGRLAPQRTAGRADVNAWKAFFAQSEYVQDAKFGVLGGTFTDEQRTSFDHYLLFSAHARLRSGVLASVGGRVHLIWKRPSGSDAADVGVWRITEFRTERFEVTETRAPLFEEVLDRAVPDPYPPRTAREPRQEQLTAAFLKAPPEPYAHFTVQSHDRHPSVSVVDI